MYNKRVTFSYKRIDPTIIKTYNNGTRLNFTINAPKIVPLNIGNKQLVKKFDKLPMSTPKLNLPMSTPKLNLPMSTPKFQKIVKSTFKGFKTKKCKDISNTSLLSPELKSQYKRFYKCD